MLHVFTKPIFLYFIPEAYEGENRIKRKTTGNKWAFWVNNQEKGLQNLQMQTIVASQGKRKIEISNFRGKIIMFSVQISPQKPSLQWLAEPKQEEINNNKFLNKKIKIIHNRTDSFKNHKIITYENFFFLSTHYNTTLKKKRLFLFDKQDQA